MSLSEIYLNNTSNWKGFDPRFSLNHYKNKNFISSLSKDIFENIFSSGLDKDMSFAILSIWDFKKKNLPQFQILFATDKKKEPIYINEIDWEKEELSIYKEYIKFLAEKKSGLHFWDLLHIYKKFSSKIRIHKNSEDRFLVDLLQGKNETTHELSKFIERFWLWEGGFSYDYYYKNKPKLKEDFIEIIQNYFDLLNSTNSNEFCIYEIPFLLNVEGNGENIWYRSVGSLSIGTKKPINNKVNKLVSNDLISIIGSVVSTQYKAVAQLNAVKSAKAAIMARNISHNLGSHVIYYIKAAIQSFEILHQFPHLVELGYDPNNERYIIPQEVIDEAQKVINDLESQETNTTAPFLRGLIRFLNYIQERHDYIATISNNHIPYFGAVNFKDFVFDIILPDKKIERHKKDKLDKYKEQNLLLDYIAKSEKFERKEINIYFRYSEDDQSYVLYNPDKKEEDLSNGELKQLKKLRNIELSLPSGIMGRQAFFSIFENFIRNTAKHQVNKKEHERKIEIVISVKPEGDFYTYRLYDKNSFISNTSFKEKIKIALRDSYVKDGALNEKYKGIKEMRISAAWLRGLQVENIRDEQNIDDYGDAILKALFIDAGTEKEIDLELETKPNKKFTTLCYEFKIPIAKKMVIISENKSVEVNENLKNQFAILTPDEYLNDKELKNYKLTIIDSSLNLDKFIDSPKTIDKIKKVSNVRCLEYSLLSKFKFWNTTKGLDRKNLNLLYNHLYKEIIEENLKLNNFQINIDDYEVIIYETGKAFKDDREINFSGVYRIHKNEKIYEDLKNKDTKFIFFKTHSDTISEFEEVMNENPKIFRKASFVEGISGHNSTDRLLRNENFTKEWRLKMLESALTHITIVDERIYDNLKSETKTSKKGKQFTSEDLQIYYESVETFEKFVKDNFKHLMESKFYPPMKYMIRNNKVFEEYELKFLKELNQSKTSIANVLDKKNISVFNLNKSEEDKFELWQLTTSKEVIQDTNPLPEVHFVSVHQGILEKIKTNDNIDDAFNQFKKLFPAKHYIVHSGRAKPSDLPKNVAFVQFSSLEAALNDCKFSLSELMYNSIIEKD